MDRDKQLEEIAKEYLQQRYSVVLQEIERYYQSQKGEIMEQLACKLRKGLEDCKKKNKSVIYIIFSILESSILTKSYELQIALCDERLYLDENAVYVYWTPSFLFEHVEEDMLLFHKKASQTVIRIREYEVERVRKQYVVNHYFQVSVLLRDMIPAILSYEKADCAVLGPTTSILFGKYMERPMLLYYLEREKTGGGIHGQ